MTYSRLTNRLTAGLMASAITRTDGRTNGEAYLLLADNFGLRNRRVRTDDQAMKAGTAALRASLRAHPLREAIERAST